MSNIREEAERAGIVQLREEKAWGNLTNVSKYPAWGVKKKTISQ